MNSRADRRIDDLIAALAEREGTAYAVRFVRTLVEVSDTLPRKASLHARASALLSTMQAQQ